MRGAFIEKHGAQVLRWMENYLKEISELPVTPNVSPGEIFNKIPDKAPEKPIPFESIFKDFEDFILPGMTHWQHPGYYGYFPANNSDPSILAEMVTATMGAQCMLWVTSPAATELEEKMMNWLQDGIGLPDSFSGVIQDTASTATICALLTAREKATDFKINEEGFYGQRPFTIYCSEEAHSSVDKAVKIAGFGSKYLRKIAVDEHLAMIPEALEAAIKNDKENGLVPLCVIATFGTTGTTAIDPLLDIGHIAEHHRIWYHIDAAYLGTMLLLPEKQHLAKGFKKADSFLFNPHKWMFTNFDCTAYFVKDPQSLVHTFAATPEYLRTEADNQVHNYRDWGIQLGRRFRALKLWFVIGSYGMEGIRSRLREHLSIAEWLLKEINNEPDFEVMAPLTSNLVCFRLTKPGQNPDTITEQLMKNLNRTRKIFLTHTRIRNKFAIRMVCGQTHITLEDVQRSWQLIREEATKI